MTSKILFFLIFVCALIPSCAQANEKKSIEIVNLYIDYNKKNVIGNIKNNTKIIQNGYFILKPIRTKPIFFTYNYYIEPESTHIFTIPISDYEINFLKKVKNIDFKIINFCSKE